ncbi:MAG: hypothetical protein LBL43_03510 [Treponema sp.]|jgi:hypothetical protein|nr:hypothetical protein [Treponema sp.]
MKDIFKNRGLRAAAVILLAFSVLNFSACDNGGDNDVPLPLADLVNSVWGGGTPRADDWLTITFRDIEGTAVTGFEGTPGLRAVCSFSADNSTNNYEFTYNEETKSGSITGSNWAPGDFTISKNNGAITFSNYGGGHGKQQFARFRQGDLTADAVTGAGKGTTAADLTNSVWGGNTPQGSGIGWLTITLKNITEADDDFGTAGLRAVCAFSWDNTTNDWTWEGYNQTARTGTITRGTSSGWQGPGAFTISADGKTMTFSNYGNHDTGTDAFKRLR